MDPIAEPLELPDGYGRVTGTLAWPAVRAELERALRYWLATTTPHGRTHVVPVDGVWLDDVWFYGGSERAAHYRNALDNPNAVMHLPDPMRAVIVEGVVRLAHPSPETAERLAQASKAKYGYAPDPSAYDGALGLFPRRVRAWTAFPSDATRFRFA
jgi:Pyridoxamine 5'-phosphate oxidase